MLSNLWVAGKRQLTVGRENLVNLISLLVGIHGAFIVASTLVEQVSLRHAARLSDFTVNLPLLIGLSLLYLSSRLYRRKHTAWLATVISYGLFVLLSFLGLAEDIGLRAFASLTLARGVFLPVIIIILLLSFRREFNVRSDTRGFRSAARFSLVILLVAFIYGVAGFKLLDEHDFHQNISWPAAAHYTLDQFDLTTARPVRPYTPRAHLFVDSLSIVSLVAVGYAAIAFFQPLRARFGDQTANRQIMADLLARYGAPSEDFFKLWPHDKQYFFNDTLTAGLAFHAHRGVALALGDPVGQNNALNSLIASFNELCRRNDWLPAFIHITSAHRRLFQKNGFTLQKIGQEAVVDLELFSQQTARNKYFRHIRNRFTKQGFSCDLLKPPHHPAVLERLQVISSDWLAEGGHVERRFAMGYFSAPYMQQCDIMVARDAAGTIQAFVNQVPAPFDQQEATFDLLRHTKNSLGNINDFLLMNFIDQLWEEGYKRLNLGLSPLTGLDKKDEAGNSLIGGFLRFAYANGDRLYSFSGLQRFKSKYEPQWRDRYVAYKGGIRGFSRTSRSLMGVMRLRLPRRA